MTAEILADISNVVQTPHPVFGVPLGIGLFILLLLKTFKSENSSDNSSRIDTSYYGQHAFNQAGFCLECGFSREYLVKSNKFTCIVQPSISTCVGTSDYGQHKFNQNGFCLECGFSREFLVKSNKEKCVVLPSTSSPAEAEIVHHKFNINGLCLACGFLREYLFKNGKYKCIAPSFGGVESIKETVPSVGTCPKCGKGLPKIQMICLFCGFDDRPDITYESLPKRICPKCGETTIAPAGKPCTYCGPYAAGGLLRRRKRK